MNKNVKNDIEYYTFESFPKERLFCACFTRKGGVSPDPWRSLNLGGTVGDIRGNVVENRFRVFSALGRDVESLYDVWQVHGSDYKVADKPRELDKAHEKADIILTQTSSLTLLMRFADCVPIFLFDPINNAIAIAHAGWVGTLNKIAEKAVHAMCKEFGSLPGDIISGIGPSIGPDHYEIGNDLCDKLKSDFPNHYEEVITKYGNRTHLDLWELNSIVLHMAGVVNIEVARICTACHREDWYSHRGENGRTGRFGALFALR
jgi:YfiH family protein